jgi:opacity protein-like surface antigen
MTFVDRKDYLALTLTFKQLPEVIASSLLLFANLAIFASLASAQQHVANPANLAFDSTNAAGDTPDSDCYGGGSNACSPDGGGTICAKEKKYDCGPGPSVTPANGPKEGLQSLLSNERLARAKPPDFDREIYYRNKLEFSFDVGWNPINIPFPFDFLEGDSYSEHPLKYTLVPIVGSLRWQMSSVGGPWLFRGNWDLTASGSATVIPKGPETRYFSYDMGIRRNFVPRDQRIAPYGEIRLGVGEIDAKGPKGVAYAQGENWPEFTVNMGSGVRYNFSPRYAFSVGINYMHLSNLDLSEHRPTAADPHWGPINYGINVVGPMFGIDVQLSGHPRQSER